jgi:hypothetical protein
MRICAKCIQCRHMQSPQYRRQQHCSECTLTNADTCSAFDKGQLVLVHAELLIPAETCTCIPGSRIVKKHANTRPALDTGLHMRNHDRISRSTETCTFMLSSSYWLTHDDTNQHMQVHAKLSIHAQTCVHTLSSCYWPTYKILCQLLINAERCPTPNTRNTCRHTLSSRYVQTQPSVCADTC